ncbi:MAG: hypothetical protein OHK0045_25580 [Raineya sp.]
MGVCFLVTCSPQEAILEKLLSEILPKNFTGTLLVLSEAECVGCSLDKNALKIQNELQRSKNWQGLVFVLSKRGFSERILKEKLPQISNWQTTTNVEIMVELAKITDKKSGPYLVEYHQGKINKIVSLSE